jgi:acylphosphatase
VRGKVQGVFYRATTAREASRLGIKGWARNLDDGSVEVVANGSTAALDALAAALWRGSPAAQVTSVKSETCDAIVSESFDVW